VRSPNIVTMLGTKDVLELELLEGQGKFDLPLEYNPRATRRTVRIDGADRRSPLTEHHLSQLLPRAPRPKAVNWNIVGSTQLGIDTVTEVLAAVATERGLKWSIASGSDDEQIRAFRFPASGPAAPVLIVDGSTLDEDQSEALLATVRALPTRGSGQLITVLGISGVGAAMGDDPSGERTVALECWSGDGIRAWNENPLSPREHRDALLTHSGGWPVLVEQAVRQAGQMYGVSEIWDNLKRFPSDPQQATRFLAEVGADQDRDLIRTWAQLVDDDADEPPGDIAAALDLDLADFSRLAHRWQVLQIVRERNGNYLLDPVVRRAALLRS
jgi:hypothetical protein